MDRINRFKLICWIILGIALAVGVTRFIYGLGVTTNLTDNHPWGFWIGFDVMGGVALAAGGFVIAAFNYIFGKKEFHPVARAAILTAFLGYIAVAVGLLFDLGLPWNIWHMIVFWNPHSPLFEVGWCVMLYLTVLFLEFAPVILEKFPQIPFLDSIHKFLFKLRIPLVILGIMLSTLHQSSLGSLFLTMPYKLHPLWYSPILPVIFFISAICLGLMMVMTESMTTSYLYRKEFEANILKKISKAAVFMLIIYLTLRFVDIFSRGAGVMLFDGTVAAYLFWCETLMVAIIPILIFLIPGLTKSINWLYIASLSGVFGIVFNRLNVGGLTHLNNLGNIGSFYFPSWMELAVSAGVVSAAMLVFFYFIENYKVWDEIPVDPEDAPSYKPKFDTNMTYLGPTKPANRTKFSFALVIAFGFAFAIISGSRIESKGIEIIGVTKARGGDTLFIDGNRDSYGVIFKHKFHEEILGNDASCVKCHHMNNPGDEATGCYECHYNMYSDADVFKHDWHASSTGANQKCFECHTEDKYKSKESAKDCNQCHKDLIPEGAWVEVKQYMAPAYTDAMHGLCINCHTTKLKSDFYLATRSPDLDKCVNCHPTEASEKMKKKLFSGKNVNKWVVLPTRVNR